VLEYLKTFRILLVLDNLETVIDDRVRDLLKHLPHGSKVLITSRIGVGTENPFTLAPLPAEEATRLLRTLVRVRDVHALRDLTGDEAEALVIRMKCHPAYIKWFVSGVQAGLAPERLVEESGLLLDHCMSSVLDCLGEDARAVLRSMLVLTGSHTLAELSFLNEFPAARIQAAVLELTTTNFLTQMRGGAAGTGYALSDFAKAYLQKTYPVPATERTGLLIRYQERYRIGGDLQAAHSRDPYAPDTLDIRGAGDVSAARCLRAALESARNGRYDEAINLCREAADLAPGYHEPHRVAGYIHECASSYAEAFDAYDYAKDLAPDDPCTRYFFGRFLVGTGYNQRQGLHELQLAARLDEESTAVRIAVAHAQLEIGGIVEAIDIASNLAQTSAARSPVRATALYTMLRAAVMGADDARQEANWARLAEIVEPAAVTVEQVEVEDLDTHLFDYCMALERWAQQAGRAAADDFIARRCDECARRLRDRRHQAGPGHFGRRLGSVENLFPDQGYGFVHSDDERFLLPASALWERGYFESLQAGSTVAFHPGPPRHGADRLAEAVFWIR
jgi:tetratricopeptide (TPR) repeat protein